MDQPPNVQEFLRESFCHPILRTWVAVRGHWSGAERPGAARVPVRLGRACTLYVVLRTVETRCCVARVFFLDHTVNSNY